MTEHPSETPRERGSGIPRDMPDQEAGGAKTRDQWYADEPSPEEGSAQPDQEEEVPGEEEELPDTDVAGTGPRGKPQPGGVHPDQPPPVEPTD